MDTMILKRAFKKIFQSEQTLPDTKPKPLIFNEAVNFEKQCIFIAIPKTGSTSIRSQIRQTGTPLIDNSHLSIIQVRDALYTYFLKKALGQNESFPTRNIQDDEAVRIKSERTFKKFFKFSSVRNPWARVVSLYYRRDGIEVREKISFEDFCEQHMFASDTCYHPTIKKNQLDWLSDEKGNCIMDYVYKLENLDRAIEEIKIRTSGRIHLKNLKINANPNSRASNYRDMYTEKTKKMIAKTFEKDIDYFKYTF